MAEIEIKKYKHQFKTRQKVFDKHNKKKFHYRKVTKVLSKKYFILKEGKKIFGRKRYSNVEGKKFDAVSSLMNLSYKLKKEKKLKHDVESYGTRRVSYISGKTGKKITKSKVKYKLMIRGKNAGLTKTFSNKLPSGIHDYLVQLQVYWKTETRRGRVYAGWGYSNIALIHDAKDFKDKKQTLIASSWGQFCSEYSLRYDDFESAVYLKTRIAIYK